ncbi:hypothetical protein ACWHLZ_39300 [Streptomyces chartreusis]
MLALAHQFKEAAPETPVILTVHELKRLARNAAELNLRSTLFCTIRQVVQPPRDDDTKISSPLYRPYGPAVSWDTHAFHQGTVA